MRVQFTGTFQANRSAVIIDTLRNFHSHLDILDSKMDFRATAHRNMRQKAWIRLGCKIQE